jgi:hypothetical protein
MRLLIVIAALVAAFAPAADGAVDPRAAATLEGGAKPVKLAGAPCPAGTGCTAGPGLDQAPTLKCRTGERLVLRLHAAAEHVTFIWAHAVPFATDPTLVAGNAHRAHGGRAWSLTVPAKARRASSLELLVDFRDVSTSFPVNVRCR